MNLFDELPCQASEELVTELVPRNGVRIERFYPRGAPDF